MNRKMSLKKFRKISLIVLTSFNLIVTEIYVPSPLYAEGQPPTAEFVSLLSKGEEQLQALKQEKQTKLEEQQKKLVEEERMLAEEIEEAKELREQIMKETMENNNGYIVGKISDVNLLSQMLQGRYPKGRGSDRRVKQQIQAIREGQKQVDASKKRIAEIAARYDQQMTAIEQKQAQHQAQQQTLQNKQQELLQVEKKAAQADGQAKQQRIEIYEHKIQPVTDALHSMIQDLESSITLIASELSTPANDHLKTMVLSLHAMVNYRNIERMMYKLETLMGDVPPEIIEDGSTVFLQPFQAKQRNLHSQMNKIVTQLVTINQEHVEPILQFLQGFPIEELTVEELSVFEDLLLAIITQQNAKKMKEIQQQLKKAEEREQEAYHRVGHSDRSRVEQQRLDGEVLLVDQFASWSEQGEEHKAAQRRAEAKTKQLIQVLKNPHRLSYHSLWLAIHPEQGTTLPSAQKTETNQAKQRLYTTVEQANHYASMAVDLGKQMKMIVEGVQGEHARKIAKEPTFAKFFTELGNSLSELIQHPIQSLNSIWEDNKQVVQAVENSLQASLFGPGEAETNAHIRQQVDKQGVLRTMVSLAQLMEQIGSGITVSDWVGQEQLLAALDQAAGTEEERAAYWSNLETAAENVIQVKQAKENINGQRQAFRHIFLPTVEMMEHNLFDSPGWQAQILDTMKYVLFIFLATDPIGGFVPISPEDGMILGVKAISRKIGILSKTTTKLEMIKDSAVEAEEAAGKQIRKEIYKEESAVEAEETAAKQIREEIDKEESTVEEREIQVCRPCGPGGRAKRSIECCETEPQPGISTSTEQSELDDNIPTLTEEEIAVMEGREQQSQPGTRTASEQSELEQIIPEAQNAGGAATRNERTRQMDADESAPISNVGYSFENGDLIYGLSEPRSRFIRKINKEFSLTKASTSAIVIDQYNNAVMLEISDRQIPLLKKYFSKESEDDLKKLAKKLKVPKDLEQELSKSSRGHYPLWNDYFNNEKFNIPAIFEETAREYDSDVYHQLILGSDIVPLQSKLLWKRGSKHGIEIAATNQRTKIHFILDDLDMEKVVTKEELTPETPRGGQSITASELRCVYRNRERLKGRFIFYREGERLNQAPWEENPGLWSKYEEKLKEKELKGRAIKENEMLKEKGSKESKAWKDRLRSLFP
ncbi:hypothetical protein [Paenibacillus popilliae]|uniref:Uncharacterized protein n=1 Tax=Paenibacillus popilliae ATCC 14706 TaxID=1212764 RepID=M9M1Q6_PAEPP|nr:hypothetical protein [Paenibacillus popilliae]GAC42869.1 hypothetical protein PPOP_2230 [Paenibacillus popilliae ATCC 14706]